MFTRFTFVRLVSLVPLVVGCALGLPADTSPGPLPVPLPAPIAAPKDIAYPGTIGLEVDLTDFQRAIVGVHETIPVRSGKLTLLYPRWIPGNHSPTGPISKLAGLAIMGGGKRIDWVRDRIDVYAFHIAVPDGVTSITADFQYLSPVRGDQGRISISSKIIDLAWNTVVLYPAGHFARRISFAPSVKLAEGWQFACALDVREHTGNSIQFKDTTLNTLVDSPLYAGVNYKRIDLSTSSANQVFLNIFADSPANLVITPEELQRHKNMVQEAAKLYGSHHYGHYDFLFLISDVVGGVGLEHHQSSEDGERSNYFTDWEAGISGSDLLAHEYTHSWNGKFRRPADLWTANFEVPMQDDLLWIYEGLTQYFGYVLTARSGMRTVEQTKDLLAGVAANFDASPGRKWRALVDTTNQPTISQRSPVSWVSWQRPEDYYTEGMLLWLDMDTKIRELSQDKKSIDDFAKLFFGVNDGSFVTETYVLADVVSALQSVQPFDWAAYLQAHVYELAPDTPKEGLTRGGYRLGYTDTEPAWRIHGERPDEAVSFATSLGFSVKANGDLQNVWWASPAYRAVMTPDMHIVSVNDTAFTIARLRDLLREAEKTTIPMRFLVKRGEQFETISLDYHEGLRYPQLQRLDGVRDRLAEILAPAK